MEKAVYKENMKTMHAVSSCRQGPSCTNNARGVGPESSYRSRKYNPDPRYHQSQANPLYISSEEAYRQLKNQPKEHFLYNMPKKSATNGPPENVQGEQEPSDSYQHRDINHLYTNLQNPNARPCLPKARTFYVCSECGCSYPKGPDDRKQNEVCNPNPNNGNRHSENECRPQQDENSGRQCPIPNEVEVSVECKPEMASESGCQIIYFTFNINKNPDDQESSCPSTPTENYNENTHNNIDLDVSDGEWDDGMPIKIGSGKSPFLWWNCNESGCLCQAIQKGNGSSSATNYNKSTAQASQRAHTQTNCPVPNHTKSNGQELCTQICTIRGENGEIIKLPCHYCFNVDQTEIDEFAIRNSMPRNVRNSNRNTQNCSQRSRNNGQYSGGENGAYLFKDTDRKLSNKTCCNQNWNNDNGCQPNGVGNRKNSQTREQMGINSTDQPGPYKKSESHDRTSKSRNNKDRETDQQLDNNSCICGCVCHNFPKELWQNEDDQPKSYKGLTQSNSPKNLRQSYSGGRALPSDGGRVLPSNGGNAL